MPSIDDYLPPTFGARKPTRQQTAEDAARVVKAVHKKLAGNPLLEADLRALWCATCDVLEAHYAALGPKPKVFEVHHTTELARLAFLTAFLELGATEPVKAAALTTVGVAP